MRTLTKLLAKSKLLILRKAFLYRILKKMSKMYLAVKDNIIEKKILYLTKQYGFSSRKKVCS